MLSVIGVSRQALLAAVLGLGLIAPAFAETVTVTDITSGDDEHTILTIPTVELTDANIGEEEVRTLFSRDGFSTNSEMLIGLTARAISIPEIRAEERGGEGSVVITGIELTDVANGIAGGISVESTAFGNDEGKVEFGLFSLANLNVEYLFALHGVGNTDGLDPKDLDSIWSALSLGGATLSGPTGACSIAGIDGGAVAVRMLQRGTLQTLFEQIDKVQRQQGGPVSPMDPATPDTGAATTEAPATPEAPVAPEPPATPEASLDDLALLQSYYFDALSSYAADAITYSGIECNVENDAGDPILVRVGEIAFGETQPGTLPEITVSNMRIENFGADAGWIDLEAMRIFSTDYAAVAALFDEAGSNVDGDFLKARTRELIPSFGGFEITGLTMDLPNERVRDSRIQGGIGSFSMLFDSYVHGLPTDIRASATDVSFAMPEESTGIMFGALGLDPLSLSYDLSAHWDRGAQEIIVDNLILSAANGGTIIISGVLGNAKPQLFSLDQSAAQRATQALTVKELHVHVADEGLLTNAIAMIAAQQKIEPDQFRTALSGMSQGTILMGLGGTPGSMELATAIAGFINTGGELSISAVSISPAGVGMAEFQQSQGPAVLKKFVLTVGEATEEPAAEPATDQPVAAEPAAEEEAAPAPESAAEEPTPADETAAPAEGGAKEKSQ